MIFPPGSWKATKKQTWEIEFGEHGELDIKAGNSDEEDESIARLIAAAPDLLAACEVLLSIAEHYMPEPTHDGSCGPWASCDGNCSDRAGMSHELFKARDAIAKAKGETHA